MASPRQQRIAVMLGIALLAIVAYIPTVTQPFIEDDYANILAARSYGPVAGWPQMLDDDVNRVRATTWLVTHWIDASFGPDPRAFYIAGILLHVLNCWLVFAFGGLPQIGYRTSAWAASFFALDVSHQEAIMWYSACNELLMFLFGMAALLAWLRSANGEPRPRLWYAASIVLFALALLSKEAAVIFVPLMVIATIAWGNRNKLLLLLPFAGMAAVDVFLILGSREHSFRFSDGSFDPGAAFWITWPASMAALLWPWGLLALGMLVFWRRDPKIVVSGLVWNGIVLVPYMFLTYMHRIPSRQTYLAGFGLALIVGAAAAALIERRPAGRLWIAYALLAIVGMESIGYLWLKKRPQFLERADPTEQLVRFAGATDGPIFVECFPRDAIHARAALEVRLGQKDRLIFPPSPSPADAHSFCYDERTRIVKTK